MIRYSRACGSYQDFFDRGLLLTRKLLNQGFHLVKLKSSLRTFYGDHHDLVDRYGISVTNDHGYVPLVVTISWSFPHSRLITGFVTRLTRRVPLVEKDLLAFRSQKPYIVEEQTTQWPKEKVLKDKQRSTKHTYKTKDQVTRTPLKTGGEHRCSGRQAGPSPLVAPVVSI
jgi:hypothetical protein